MSNLWAFLLLIGPLIFVHELGHLLAAKLLDVKATRFSLGFGPPILRVRMGETEYCVAPIPLGGYVQLLGHVPGEDIPAADHDRALPNKPLWVRIIVLAAGPLANLALPVLIYFVYFLMLAPTTLPPAVIGTVVDGSAAEQAGLQQGDRIVAIDGRDVRSWGEMASAVLDAPGVELKVQIERDDKRLDRVITPQRKMVRNDLGRLTPVGQLGVVSLFYAPQIGIVDLQSPAYQAGLRTGDVITSINGEPVRTLEELRAMLEVTGDAQVRLTYLRATPYASRHGTFLWYESAHAQLRARGGGVGTGLLPANTFLRTVEPGSPAEAAGLKAGDRILAVDGHPFQAWEYLNEVLSQRQDKAVDLEVETPGERSRKVSVAQVLQEWKDIHKQDRKAWWFGAVPYRKTFSAPPEPIRGRFTYALSSSLSGTAQAAKSTWEALREMLTFERGVEDISSVVAIYNLAGSTAEEGPGSFLQLMVVLSVNLCFVNLLPIPVLDGGHILFFTVEAIRRRPLGLRGRQIAAWVGLIIILLLLLIALRNDIVRWYL